MCQTRHRFPDRLLWRTCVAREGERAMPYIAYMAAGTLTAAYDRVIERRRAVALAHHFRQAEGLSITQIADRLGRSPATVKAYFYDPTDANKGLSREGVAKAGGRESGVHLPAAAARGEILPRR